MLKPSGLPPSKGGDNRTGLGLASFVSSNAAGSYDLHVRGEDDVSYLKSGSGDWERSPPANNDSSGMATGLRSVVTHLRGDGMALCPPP